MSNKAQTRKTRRQSVLVLQGGGALGAYEYGAYKALSEQRVRFDVVAGVSIGAVNGAIIAGNPESKRLQALEGFWEEASIPMPYIPNELLRRSASAMYSLMFGHPQLFTPRWFNPRLSAQSQLGWTSFYSARPMKRLVERYVDFDHLAKHETRLFLAAVNVTTGQMELFDSYEERLHADHVLASGSLPPGLPWTTIDGKAYWDGAIVSNAPLREILDQMATECYQGNGAEAPKMVVYLVDLFSGAGPLPNNIGEVLMRYKDILYAAKIERDIHQCEVGNNTFTLLSELLSQVPEEVAQRIRRDLRFRDVLCHACTVDVVRISHKGEGKDEFHFKDYDFSRQTVQGHVRMGHRDALAALEEVKAAH